MISKIDLISENYFRDIVPFNGNVDFKDIAPHINLSQDIFLQPILGSNFYDEILGKYDAQTLSTDEITLVAHIKPCVAFRTALAAIPFITFNVKNKGIQTQSGDFSTDVEASTLHFIANKLENSAEFYERRLINYLEDNEALFPGFTVNNDDDMKPDGDSPFDSGIALYD